MQASTMSTQHIALDGFDDEDEEELRMPVGVLQMMKRGQETGQSFNLLEGVHELVVSIVWP